MSTPQIVPPKAVLRVLQGLLFGTSCSLAVLIEDRRRRINAVQTVLENGRRLRALPLYREGGTERAIARALAACNIDKETANMLRESLVPNPSLFDQTSPPHRTHQPPHDPVANPDSDSQNSRGQETPLEYGPTLHHEPANNNEATVPSQGVSDTPITYPVPVYHYNRMTFAKYLPGMGRLSERHRKSPLSRAIRGSVDRPGKYEMATTEMIHVITTVTGLLSSDEREWNRGWEIAMQTLSKPATRPILETALLDNVIHLARALEESGRVSEAGRLISLVTRSDTTTVSASEPNYVERIVVSHIDSLCSTPAQHPEKRTQAIDRAVHFYIAAFHFQPPADLDSALSMGLRLVPLIVDIGLCELANKLVRSCVGTDPRFWELQNLYVSSLLLRNAYLDAIDHFLSDYSQYPDSLSYDDQVQSIVDATFQVDGLRSSAIIEFLVGTPWARSLRPSWIAKLLECHWKHAKNYAKTKKYFQALMEYCSSISASIPSRTMIQIAFAAGETVDAQEMVKEYQDVSGGINNQIILLGTLGLKHAMNGEWEEVKSIFQSMVEETRGSMKAHSRLPILVARALPPVIKEFANAHTLEEIVAYARFFLGNLEIPVDKYLVTLLAKKYTMRHDILGLVEWLDFCASRGFVNDTAFLTAILSSCRHWGYGYTKISLLARKMHQLNPNFDRRAYVNILRDAAAQTKSRQVKALRHAVEPVEMGNERAVCRAMVAAIRRGAPQTAMEIYGDIKSTREIDRNGTCLREAIRASVLHENGDSSGALALLREGQQRGQNIAPSLMPILAAHLDALPVLVDPVTEFLGIVNDLKNKQGIALPSSAFTLGSYRFLKFGRYQDAIRFCRIAMDMDGSPEVATTKHHFSILMEAYAMIGLTTALEALFVSVRDSSYKADGSCLRSLRRVRFQLMSMSNREWKHETDHNVSIRLIGSMIKIFRAQKASVARRAGVAEERMLQMVADAAAQMTIVAGQPLASRQKIPPRHHTSSISASPARIKVNMVHSAAKRKGSEMKSGINQERDTTNILQHPGQPVLAQSDTGSDFDDEFSAALTTNNSSATTLPKMAASSNS